VQPDNPTGNRKTVERQAVGIRYPQGDLDFARPFMALSRGLF
jgi:hypothetical protein